MAEKYAQNLHIIEQGTIRQATKLPVITIGLGLVRDLKDLDEVVRHQDGDVELRTKENPEWITYEQDRTAVVRVVGGKVLIDGRYDIYAPSNDKIRKLLSNPIDLEEELTSEQLGQLKPLFEVASEVVPSMAPSEHGRRVVVVTAEMLKGADYLVCELPLSWAGGKATFTDLYEGDIFLVEDATTGKGYRIGAQEFAETHALE